MKHVVAGSFLLIAIIAVAGCLQKVHRLGELDVELGEATAGVGGEHGEGRAG